MVDATDGTTYEDWLSQATSPDSTARLGAEYAMVVLYDTAGRPQRVRGSSVKGMLAKRSPEGKAVFFAESPE
jgi:hypothetical protein